MESDKISVRCLEIVGKKAQGEVSAEPSYSLVLVFSGFAEILEEKHWISISRGSHFIVPPNLKCPLAHVEGLMYYRILFSKKYLAEIQSLTVHLSGYDVLFPTTPSMRVALNKRQGLFLDKSTLDTILPLLRKMEKEERQASAESGWLMKSYFFELAIHISRYFTKLGQKKVVRSKEIEAAQNYMETHFSEDLKLADIARSSSLTQNHFLRVFEETVGTTPMAYLRRLRIRKSAELLAHSDKNITELAYEIGFPDSNNFARVFRQQMGLTPSQYRQRALENDVVPQICIMMNFFRGVFEGPYFPKLLNGIFREFAGSVFRINIASLNLYMSIEEWNRLVEQRLYSGLILINSGASLYHAGITGEIRIPSVSIGEDLREFGVPSILHDDYSIGWEAADHFLEKGHTRFASIAMSESNISSQARLKGFRARLKEDDIRLKPENVHYIGHQLDTVTEFTRKIVESRDRITAVFCATDRIATKFYECMGKLGKRIPDDCSCLGVDNDINSSMLHPALTTFDLDVDAAGILGAQMIQEKLSGKKMQTLRKLGARFIERGSVRKIR